MDNSEPTGTTLHYTGQVFQIERETREDDFTKCRWYFTVRGAAEDDWQALASFDDPKEAQLYRNQLHHWPADYVAAGDDEFFAHNDLGAWRV